VSVEFSKQIINKHLWHPMSKFSISFGVTSTAQAIVGTSLIPKSGHMEHFFPSSSDKKLTRLSPLTGTIVPLKLFLNFFSK